MYICNYAVIAMMGNMMRMNMGANDVSLLRLSCVFFGHSTEPGESRNPKNMEPGRLRF